MPKEPFETPDTQDLEEMARQIDAALVEARQALERPPVQKKKPASLASNANEPDKQDAPDAAA